ncbi:hypothetical protein CPB83DRAFT_848197 [Crepidotus variabilis]|uniref:Zn(2)-C6 fungal-type domain-containing protein n=1 Tax=Crepidotus variabilis TaxID=179855 RepID=A0A9P6EN84_9AGAR|nr:hypothetical protein CPB83DRAFT_848197 [Crepidotus variabilis]
MPKASPGSANINRSALRRNQACKTCRKRKLKCDAARPHCGTCVKHWQALVSVPAPIGYVHPTEPQCSYDPVDGLNLAPETDPLSKIKELEDQISSLKNQLFERQAASASSTTSDSTSRQEIITGITIPQAPLSLVNIIPESPQSRFRNRSPSPNGRDVNGGGITNNAGGHRDDSPDPLIGLLFSGWNPDLPDPAVLNHYVDIFFRCDPCGSRVLHKPSFMHSLSLSPRDVKFPHSAILHAICASASRWSGANTVTLPDGTRRDKFAEFHASKTRQYIDKTMASGEEIFSVMQACIILSWYFYQEGRWVEVWIFASFQTRVAIPLRLNYPGTFSTHGNSSPGAYLAPPKDRRDLEARRRTWWMTIMFDRIASVGGWIHAVDERDLGTELPLRLSDFELDTPVPSNPQNISTEAVFVRHHPQYTDSFMLLLKAVMLFGRVTDFNVRGTLRAPTAPSKNQNPFFLTGFQELDELVSSQFLENLPPIFKNNNGVTDAPEGSYVDTDLYMVHVIPHAATITLHNPYIDFSNPTSTSTERCVRAARCILAAYYTLSATSIDICRLHPLVTICWYLAAAVQVQLCKYFIEINDAERESTVWGEINILRFAMMQYGQRSPIGTRQEKLLQGLMREIVRMTAQKQPLEVGIPLYPFSHQTLFRKDEPPQPETDESLTGAPLPGSPEADAVMNRAPSSASDSNSIPNSHLSPSPLPRGTLMTTPTWSTPDYSNNSPGNGSSHSYVG